MLGLWGLDPHESSIALLHACCLLVCDMRAACVETNVRQLPILQSARSRQLQQCRCCGTALTMTLHGQDLVSRAASIAVSVKPEIFKDAAAIREAQTSSTQGLSA